MPNNCPDDVVSCMRAVMATSRVTLRQAFIQSGKFIPRLLFRETFEQVCPSLFLRFLFHDITIWGNFATERERQLMITRARKQTTYHNTVIIAVSSVKLHAYITSIEHIS